MFVVSPAPRSVWGELLASDPGAMPSQTPEWLDVACRQGGWRDASRLYELGSGRAVVLPLAERRYGRWTVRASLPRRWDAGGLVAAGGVRPDEVAAVLRELAADRGRRTFVRPGFSQAAAWAAAWDSVAARRGRRGASALAVARRVHVLDLSGGLDAVWGRRVSAEMRKGVRRARRRAEAAGVVVRWGNSPELLAMSEEVHRQWVDRRAAERHLPRPVARLRAARAEPASRARALLGALGDAAAVGVALAGGVPVATQVLLFQGAVAVFWRAYADLDASRSLLANVLMFAEAIEFSCRRGCRVAELGESGGIASLERFKERFGALAWPMAEYTLERLPVQRLAVGAERLVASVDRHLLAHRTARAPASPRGRPRSPRGTNGPTPVGGAGAP